MRSLTRDRLINLSFLFGTVIGFFVVGEVSLRVTGVEKGHPGPPQIFRTSADPRISYELRPNVHERAYRRIVTTNSLGFRSPEIDPQKRTIAVLGDSISFGYGVADDQTLSAKLSGLLAHQYNVLNAGVPGYTLSQEVSAYDTKIRSLDPAALIIVFYWNDLHDMDPGVVDDEGNLRPAGWQREPRRCNPIETGILGLVPGRCWLDLHSAFYRTVKKLVSARTERSNLRAQQKEFKEHPEQESVRPENIDRYARTLSAFASALPASMPKLFVIWPDKELHAPTRPKLRSIAGKAGFTVIDLYDTFGNEVETLSWDTVHPSVTTIEKAAVVIKHELDL
ncbi:MAG: hypothetical protein Greene041619_63 [Candidatus Peregrinibacteria bacterium Greene0416_19]|nr:MAG: hypothetical protein Greene041619_63 [Candidatus Peregrinibacteria bacterium Greene0416_19]